MKNRIAIGASLAFFAASSVNALTITETFDENTQIGSYTVSLAPTDPGNLTGFGVSNPLSMAYVGSVGDDFGCDGSGSYFFSLICYGSKTLNATNWGTETADDSGSTFEEIFGAFSNHVDSGETTINWYHAVDGDMVPGDTSSSDFFLFSSMTPASIGLALFGNGTTATGISVTGPSAVPLPATGFLLAGAIGGLGFARRRKKKS